MGRKFAIEENAEVKRLNCRHNNRLIGASSSPADQNSSCCYKTAEFLCSACLLCVSCPLAIVWCCIKLPCKVGWRAAKRTADWACCRSEKRILADYSSFSDIDSDPLPTAKVQYWSSRSFDGEGCGG